MLVDGAHGAHRRSALAVLADLLLAEADATVATLVKNGRPTRVIRLPAVDERVMGALMMHFMLETMFAAELRASMPSISRPSRRARS